MILGLLIVIFSIALVAAIIVPVIAGVAWIVMLLLGAFAALTGFTAAAIGFWPCVIIVLLAGILFGGSNS